MILVRAKIAILNTSDIQLNCLHVKSKLNDISNFSIKGGNKMYGTIMSELGQLVNLKYLILCELVHNEQLNYVFNTMLYLISFLNGWFWSWIYS